MTELQEGRYAGEFVVSEGNGRISRETMTVLSGQSLQAGAVLGKVTASGKYKALNPAASDGSQAAAGVLYDAVDASGADPGASPSCASPRSTPPSWSGPPASPGARRLPHSASSHP
jgi:hypothetical protein